MRNALLKTLINLQNDERGTAVLEYALVASIVSVGALAIMGTFNLAVGAAFQGAIDALSPTP